MGLVRIPQRKDPARCRNSAKSQAARRPEPFALHVRASLYGGGLNSHTRRMRLVTSRKYALD